MTDPLQFTRDLNASSSAGGPPLDEVVDAVYDELRGLAATYLRRERSDHTLQPTALVHEAWARLVDVTQVPWSDAANFRAIAARVMRRVLVEHARKHGALKRGGDRVRVTLGGGSEPRVDDSTLALDVLALDESLDALRSLHRRKANVVELLDFGGLTHAEAEPQLRRAWALRRALDGDAASETIGAHQALASNLMYQARFDEAIALTTNQIELIRSTRADPVDPQLLAALGALGVAYLQVGRYADAAPILETTLESKRRVQGDLDPSTSTPSSWSRRTPSSTTDSTDSPTRNRSCDRSSSNAVDDSVSRISTRSRRSATSPRTSHRRVGTRKRSR